MGFFESFWGSSMPKRLLRYTLSKLDYFDTDALDSDNLDFAMGMNTVFTLQDVGIKLQACVPCLSHNMIFNRLSCIEGES